MLRAKNAALVHRLEELESLAYELLARVKETEQ